MSILPPDLATSARASIRGLGGLLVACAGAGSLAAAGLDALGLNPLGFGAFDVGRNAVAITVYLLLAALFLPQTARWRLGLVFLIPLLTQFYQLGLGWDFDLGPSSLIRVMPYVAVLAAAGAELWRWKPSLSRLEQMGWTLCAGVGLVGWAASSGSSTTGLFGFLALGIVLPALAVYVRASLQREPELRAQLIAAGFWGFAAFAIGTLVVVRMGSAMELGGVTGLLGTRNISDYNLIFAYMLLLWPLALMGAASLGAPAVGGLCALFLASAIIGLSRTGILIVPILSLAGILALYARQPKAIGQACLSVLLMGALAWSALPNRDTLGMVWAQRFNVASAGQAFEVLERVRPGGSDSAARDQLRLEALRLFQQDPLFGQGFGGFGAWSLRGFNDAHSLTFTTLAEHGALGLFALYLLIGWLALRLVRMASWNGGPTALFALCFAAWLFSLHTVGGNLALLSERGFNINVINGLLLVIYLLAHHLVKPTSATPMRAAA